ncbi:MAG: energy transducer TonB [Gemmatimonadota bacterium]
MLETRHETEQAEESNQRTANDRFKQRFSRWFWSSLSAATMLHFGAFVLMPQFTAPALGHNAQTGTEIVSVGTVDVPPPPPMITAPAATVIGTADVGPDVTIPSTTFQDNPVPTLPPPPTQSGDLSRTPTVTPFTQSPVLRNQAEVANALLRFYPPLLRDAGISGTVKVWFFIDANGRVVKTQINVSSGYQAFDAAAVKVANLMKFRPAVNMDRKVPVWVSIPIVFQIQ